MISRVSKSSLSNRPLGMRPGPSNVEWSSSLRASALVAEIDPAVRGARHGLRGLEVQKLAWFLQRAFKVAGTGDPLRLRFTANKYGPYADQLRHLLDAMDGSYLRSERRMSEASPYEAIWFADERREEVAKYLDGEAKVYAPALDATTSYIEGFESPWGWSCSRRSTG